MKVLLYCIRYHAVLKLWNETCKHISSSKNCTPYQFLKFPFHFPAAICFQSPSSFTHPTTIAFAFFSYSPWHPFPLLCWFDLFPPPLLLSSLSPLSHHLPPRFLSSFLSCSHLVTHSSSPLCLLRVQEFTLQWMQAVYSLSPSCLSPACCQADRKIWITQVLFKKTVEPTSTTIHLWNAESWPTNSQSLHFEMLRKASD